MEREGRDRDRALAHTIASLYVAGIRGDHERALAHARSSHAVAQKLFPHDRMHGTFFMTAGHGRADYLLYVSQWAVGAIEAKPIGTTLAVVEWQSAMYVSGLSPSRTA